MGWPQIDAYVREKYGPLEELGGGLYGKAYAIDAQWVLKVTTAQREPEMAREVMRIQKSGGSGGQGFALVRSVKEIDLHIWDCGLIELERVAPWRPSAWKDKAWIEFEEVADVLDGDFHELNFPDYENALNHALGRRKDTAILVESVMAFMIAYEEPLRDLKHNLGKVITDWGPGMRPVGTVVLYDLGALFQHRPRRRIT